MNAPVKDRNDLTFAEPGDRETGPPLRWEVRVFLVALVGLVPGIQLGCIAAVLSAAAGCALPFWGALGFGGLLGMIGGGLLEADHWV
jgi:hypothetical protein